MEKLKLTWSDIDLAIYEILAHYKDEGITRVIGISRGGLPAAVKLSHLLKAEFVPLVWQTRDGNDKDIERLMNNHWGPMNEVLFVDDICDSGETIKQIKRYIPNSRWCTLLTKDESMVDFAPGFLDDKNKWIVFPWEE